MNPLRAARYLSPSRPRSRMGSTGKSGFGRSSSVVGVGLLALALGACDMDHDFSSGCIMGPCGGRTYGTLETTYLTGFPEQKVDRSITTGTGGYWGRIAVGDSVQLYLVRVPALSSPSSTPPDTIRQVTWAVSDSSVAAISAGPSGQGLPIGTGAGTVQVGANGIYYVLWACEDSGCSRVSEIAVSSPVH
jgi:hypothetical protein